MQDSGINLNNSEWGDKSPEKEQPKQIEGPSRKIKREKEEVTKEDLAKQEILRVRRQNLAIEQLAKQQFE